MKFKTMDELIDEKSDLNLKDNYEQGYLNGFEHGVSNSFRNFRQRIDFYKKWKGKDPMMLSEFVFLDYRDWIRTKSKIQEKILMEGSPIDDKWLFDYCFGDIK